MQHPTGCIVIPAKAGISSPVYCATGSRVVARDDNTGEVVIPAKAGIQYFTCALWIPASAGMTLKCMLSPFSSHTSHLTPHTSHLSSHISSLTAPRTPLHISRCSGMISFGMFLKNLPFVDASAWHKNTRDTVGPRLPSE